MAHIIITALVTQDNKGWGMAASQNLKAFYAGAHEALEWAYGTGIGWKGSYQDVGERPFKKRNPHIDLTLNGWRIDEDGRPAQVKEFNLRGGGRDRLCQKLTETMGRRFIGAFVNNVDLHEFKVGFADYYGAMKYQLREVIDLGKLTYSRDQQKVWWGDYHTSRRPEYSVIEWLAGMAEYEARLGQWGFKPSKQLHRGMGHLAKAKITPTQKAMGGRTRAHENGCACSDCGDWERVFLAEVVQTIDDTAPLRLAAV